MSEPLRRTQEWIARTITSASPPTEVATEEEAGRFVTAGPRQTRLERLAVYHDGYRARLVECLADDYPAVKHALGEEPFEVLCHDYIAAYPSRSPSLNAFGKEMAPFVFSKGGSGAGFLRDLAALEWAMVERIHAPPVTPMDLDALRDIPPDAWARARFAPSGGALVLELDYPVNRFLQAFKEGSPIAIPGPESSVTAVYRRGWSIWRMDVTPPMHRVLASLFAGGSLGDALERVGSEVESPEDVMLTFREWVAGGFFAGVDLGE